MTGRFENSRGFSLVEVLVVAALMGIVTMAIMGLYIGSQQSAYTQDEVVELQQNLRIAIDQMSRDIRNAGFMVDEEAISLATANGLTFRTGSPEGRMARIASGFTSNALGNNAITVASSDMIGFFEIGDYVRIIRPPNHEEPLDDVFRVSVAPSGTTITLNNFSTSGIEYSTGDIIVPVPTAGTTLPRTIGYALNQSELERSLDGGAGEAIASEIRPATDPDGAGLVFSFLLDDDTETATPADLSAIRAVRVTVTGVTEAADKLNRSRSLTKVVSLRNRNP